MKEMSEWKEYKLLDITEPIKNVCNPTENLNIPYIGLEHIEQETLRLNSIGISSDVASNKFRFESNDILFGKLRPYFRKVVKPKFYGICSTDIWVFRAKKGVDQNYLYYFLANWDFVDTANSGEGGTRMPRADWDYLKNMEWNIPDISEQIAIADTLSRIDDKIDLLHQQNKTLEQLAETLFRRMLLVNSKKWEMKSFGEFIKSTLGGEWGKEKSESDFTFQVCCLRGTDIADLQTGLAIRTPVRFVKEKKFESTLPKDGDLILEISGGTDDQSTGRTIYINELNRTLFPHPLIFSNFCRLIRPKKKEFSFFLYLYLQFLYHQDEFFNLENGSSGIKNLDYKYLLFELKFLLPENEMVLLEFNKEIEINIKSEPLFNSVIPFYQN